MPILFSFDVDQLRELAGDKVYRRGVDYHDAGAVGDIESRNGRYYAQVAGSARYETWLGWDEGLDGDCDCPAAEDGFCKHQVALGLAVLAMHGQGELASPPNAEARPAVQDDTARVAQWLSGLPVPRLVELVIRQAEGDRDLWRSLVARAKTAAGGPEALRDAVKTLIGSPRFLDWRQSQDYARRLEALFDMFENPSGGTPAEIMSVMLFALKKLLSVHTRIDDSSGSFGDIARRLGQRIASFGQAFASPAPALKKDVFAVLVEDDWGCLDPLSALAPALGAKGMADLQTMAEKRLASIAKPKDRFDAHAYDYRSAVRLLQNILDARGDIDGLIDLLKGSLDSGYDYLKLAELCLAHGRTRQGIEWLERGIKHAPDEFRLHDRLAEVYIAEGFAKDAIDLLANAFRRQRSSERYRALRKSALAADAWPALRERIDAEIANASTLPENSRRWLRIELRLIDGDDEGAWSLADGQSLPLHVWRLLMPMLERTRPLEAVRVLKTLIDAELQNAYNSRYRDAVDLIARMTRVSHAHPDVVAKVDGYLAELRAQHARKPKLIGMMADLSTTPSTRATSRRTRVR